MNPIPHASTSTRLLNPHIFPPESLGGNEESMDLTSQTPKGNIKRGNYEMKSEKELQGQIVNLLRLKGIEVLWHRTDKRSAATVGWPDLTFSVRRYYGRHKTGQITPCAWEVKLPTGKLSKEQAELKPKLEANGWRWRLITSVDQALEELKIMGVT